MTDPNSCDLLIQRATLFDGAGGPPIVGDLAVTGDKILVIGDLRNWSARETVDARGLALAPGFIDVHTHDDRALLIGDMANKTSQGVTSVVVGNCGVSLAPLTLRSAPPPPLDLIGAQADYRYATFADYMAALDRQPPAVNAACLVGHSTLRVGAMDRLDRPATGEEIAAMRARLREALDAGAIGLSTGLDYAAGGSGAHRRGAGAGRTAEAGGRHPHHAHAQRRRSCGRGDGRSVRDRAFGRRAGGDLALQGARPGELGPLGGDAGEVRGAAGAPAAGARRLSLLRLFDRAEDRRSWARRPR